jgi:REP element-mobilizing transposase RayT
MSADQLPQRKKLPHHIPAWVPDDARYFVTVNCRERGRNQLCVGGAAEALLKSVELYEQRGHWYTWLLVVMPDHVHMIASFNRDRGIRRVMAAWKSYQAKQHGIVWQADFFEHRLRTADEFTEKAAYIRLNPVRQGLTMDASAWPYRWERCAR